MGDGEVGVLLETSVILSARFLRDLPCGGARGRLTVELSGDLGVCFVVSCFGDFGQEGTSRGSSSPSFTNTLSPGLLVGDGGWLVEDCSTAEDVEQSVECLAVE